jgi:regulator of replication initiation timing
VATLTKPNQTEKELLKMKKLHTLTEPQKVTALVAPLPLVALVASVALLAHYIDFTSAVFIVVALLFIGSIATGVVVAVVKDEHLARVVRGYRALNTENKESALYIGELRDKVRALTAERDELAHSADYSDLAQSYNSLCATYEALQVERDNLREVSQARALNAETLRAQVAELTERVEVLQESRADWRTAYDKVRAERDALVASLANARERLASDGSDLVEHDLADKYSDKLHTFTNAVYHFGWALIEDGDLFESAKFALLAIHGENLTETASAQVFRDYVLDIYADDDAPTTPTPTDYTHSASTALLIGTLDRAYEVNGETRYPLA